MLKNGLVKPTNVIISIEAKSSIANNFLVWYKNSAPGFKLFNFAYP
jgi:hypothetical protein